MSKKEKFIQMVEELINFCDSQPAVIQRDPEAMAYFEAFKTSKEKDKPQFTDNGKLILKFMQDNHEKFNNLFKSKDIAEGLFVSSRSVSGAIRKLITDGYVEKVGEDPIIYSLTTLGKEIVIE